MASLFDASIASTNYAPSDEERAAIREFLQSRRKELSSLEGESFTLTLQLSAINQAQADVKGQIAQIYQEIERHNALLSPARTLPDDIYREIFLWCLTNSLVAQCTESLSPPLLLSSVCRGWRQIAHATPRLWTNLCIRYHDPSHAPPRTDVLEQWMQRSGALPISVVCEPAYGVMLQPAHIGLFATLAPSFSRWKDLTITLAGKEPDINALLRFLDACGSPNPFHQVDALDLALPIYVDEAHDPYLARRVAYASVMETLGLQRSTRLRTLNLSVDDDLFIFAYGLQGIPSTSSWLPRSHLQHLSIRDRSTPGGGSDITSHIPNTLAYQLLRDLPNLITFKADFAECLYEEYPSGKLVQKKLEHMSLSFIDLCDHEDLNFLPSFEFPSLSFCTVPGILPAPDLIKALSTLHSLVHLHLWQPFYDADADKIQDIPPEAKWGDGVLECLTPKAEQTAPTHACPNLQYLKWENNTWFSDRALADFILRRSSSPYSPIPLKQVHINFGRCIQQDMQQEYAELVRQGLDLRLNYFPEREAMKSNVVRGGFGWCSKSSPDLDGDSDPRAFGWPERSPLTHSVLEYVRPWE